jgi:hypothetical protein
LAALAAGAVGVAAVVAGCGGSDGATDHASASSTPPVTASASAGAGVGGTGDGTGSGGSGSAGSGGPSATSRPPKPPATKPPVPSVPTCQTANLAASVASTEGAAGTLHQRLLLTNTGSTTCAVRGFPGVSYVDASGGQLGAPADRTGPAGASIVLAAGRRAAFMVNTIQPGVLPGCQGDGTTAPAANLRVYPPDTRDALLVPVAAGRIACNGPDVHQLAVTALVAG